MSLDIRVRHRARPRSRSACRVSPSARRFPPSARPRVALARTFVALAGLAASAGVARAQLAPEDALRTLRPAEGLEVSLFAAEPDVVNPTAIDVDSRGRVWVCEGVNYRLFKNPEERPEGDRIRVLEDTDGDGRCDSARTFWQDPSLRAPLGIAVLGDRVYVCQSPDLFYLRDTDGDGVADERVVVLTGFGGVDHDHAIHGATLGPDGCIYLTVGDEGLDVSDRSGNRIREGKAGGTGTGAATVLRTDLEGERIELLATGLRNPYEPAVDSFGEVFASDNDDDGNEQCRIVHVLKGGDYGYWPRRPGDRRRDEVHWNQDLPGVVPMILRTGFGSPTGLLFHEGSLLPEPYRGTLIHADAGPRVVRSYALAPKGATFSAEARIMLSAPDDSWFRPSDVCVGPDGSVFVSDWYDPGVGGHNLRDWTRGRVWRLAPAGVPRASAAEPDFSTVTGRAAALASPNLATRFLAQGAYAGLSDGDAAAELGALAAGPDATLAARALWLARDRGEEGRKAVLLALVDVRPEFRAQAVRILARQGPEALAKAKAARRDPSPRVRRELLLALRGLDAEEAPWAADWFAELAARFDPADRHYREALGLAAKGREEEFFARVAEAEKGEWTPRLAEVALQLRSPSAVARAIEAAGDESLPTELRATALRAAAFGSGDAAGAVLIARLKEGEDPALAKAALDLLAEDRGEPWRSEARKNPELLAYLKTALGSAKTRATAMSAIARMRIVDRAPDLIAIAGDPSEDVAARVAAVDAVNELNTRFALDPLAGLFDSDSPAVAAAAARAIAAMTHDEAGEALRGALLDAGRPVALRKEIVRLLGGGRSGCLMLLDLAETGDLPADLRLDASRATNAAPFEDVRLMAAQLLPLERARGGEEIPPIPELVARAGDAARGREVFFAPDGPQCFKCHRVGEEGAEVGPGLTKIGEKLSRESLFESILAPSAAISHEYRVRILRTRSRGYLSGYVRSEDAQTIELVDANGSTTRVAVSDVVERRDSATSLMPDGLSSGMTAKDLVDLVAFLAELK